MRFPATDRPDKRLSWHRWFAWHPVRCGDQWVWLEEVERKGVTILVADSDGMPVEEWRWEYA